MSDTKALYNIVADALAGRGDEAQEAQDALEALMGRLRAAESMSECRSGKIGRLEEEVKAQFAMRQNSSEMCNALKAELDAEHARAQRAEADNAALLRALHSAYRPHAGECIRFGATGQQVRPCPCGVDALLDSEHPGAALLEELEGLRTGNERLRQERDHWEGRASLTASEVAQQIVREPIAIRVEGIPEPMREVIERTARDAALEEAAKLFAYALPAPLDSDTVQFRIRALKTGQRE